MALWKIKIRPGGYYSFAKKNQFTSGEMEVTAAWLPTLSLTGVFLLSVEEKNEIK